MTDREVRLESLSETHFDRLHDLFDAICREERFLAFTHAGSREQTAAYYRSVVAAGHTHYVAVRGEDIIGWCDVLPLHGQMRAHVGVLGMGVAETERGKGVGTALVNAAIARATGTGLSRIELTVQAQNLAAQALYKKVGFEYEGTQKRGWCLRGEYFDVHHMARLA